MYRGKTSTDITTTSKVPIIIIFIESKYRDSLRIFSKDQSIVFIKILKIVIKHLEYI